VIGLGVGEQHARAFAAIEACELRWLFDFSADKAAEVRNKLGQGKVAASFEEILADDDTDIVSIASFDHHHFAEALAAIKAGKHVFVEKPLCRTLAELKALKAAWEENSRPHLAANLVLRQAPVYTWLKQAIDEGKLGRLYAFDGDYLYGRLDKITEGWRRDVADYSVMEGGGIHMIDLMLWLSGENPATAATAANNICTGDAGLPYDDFMATTFHFPSGLIGRITANFGCVHRHHHVVRVFGTEGTFIHDDAGARIHTSRDEKAAAEPVDAEVLPASKGVLISGFVAAILAGGDPEQAARREFDLISVTAAAGRARGSPEEIEYL